MPATASQNFEDAYVSELAAGLVMGLSALEQTVKPLVRDDLVELARDCQDKRAKRVGLSPLGDSKHNAAALLWSDAPIGMKASRADPPRLPSFHLRAIGL